MRVLGLCFHSKNQDGYQGEKFSHFRVIQMNKDKDFALNAARMSIKGIPTGHFIILLANQFCVFTP